MFLKEIVSFREQSQMGNKEVGMTNKIVDKSAELFGSSSGLGRVSHHLKSSSRVREVPNDNWV
jgi:hypothetical protein